MCIFCNKQVTDNKFMENDLAYALWDKFPITKGHALVITKRHTENYFDATSEEHAAVSDLVKQVANKLQQDLGITDFNVVTNSGKDAGQVVMHFHVHVIPRVANDGIKAMDSGKKG